jgi:hypothetical protein
LNRFCRWPCGACSWGPIATSLVMLRRRRRPSEKLPTASEAQNTLRGTAGSVVVLAALCTGRTAKPTDPDLPACKEQPNASSASPRLPECPLSQAQILGPSWHTPQVSTRGASQLRGRSAGHHSTRARLAWPPTTWRLESSPYRSWRMLPGTGQRSTWDGSGSGHSVESQRGDF